MPDRAQSLGRLATWAAHRPRTVLIVCALLATFSAAWAAIGMEFRSDRSALVDPSLDWQQRYAAFKERFPHWDDAIIVVDAGGSEERALGFFDALDRRLRAEGAFTDRALWFDPSEAGASAILLESTDVAQEVVDELTRSAPLLTPGLTLERAVSLASSLGRTEELAAGIRAALGGADSIVFHDIPRRQTFTVGDTLAVGFVALDSDDAGASVNEVASGVRELRRLIGETLADPEHEGIEVGVTGISVIESDETAQSTKDAAIASAISFALIALLLIFVYRGVLVPLCALGALLIGVAWSFGWLMIGVGHLQVLSVVFTIVLLGLGVDGAIHLIARLELVHPDHDHLPGALGSAASGVGPGIVTGTLTTAVAFGATALSPFTGVAEMGFIAGGGVVLCTVAILVALPALLALLPRPEHSLRARSGGASRPFAGALGLWIDRHPAKVFAVAITAITLATLSATGVIGAPVRYDPDLVALMPPNAEAVVWERTLREADERSPWHAVVIADTEDDARRLTAELSDSPLVESVGGAGVLFPTQDQIDAVRSVLGTLPTPAAVTDPTPASDERIASLRAALVGLGIEAEAVSDHALRALSALFQSDREHLVRRISDLRSADRVISADLPPELRDRFVSPDDGLLLRVYSAPVDALGPLDPDRLGPFVHEVLDIAPSATGPAVQVHESTRVILSGYRFAALLAAGAIMLLLLIDFRSLPDAICAALPVVVGIVLLLGAMASFSVPLNFANTIVMPLIIGLGVDAGVHAVHRWRAQPDDAPAGLAGGTGRAITLTTLTTAIGFACMMIAEHRGVRSLGLVMTMGLILTWGASVFVLPPLLRIRSRR